MTAGWPVPALGPQPGYGIRTAKEIAALAEKAGEAWPSRLRNVDPFHGLPAAGARRMAAARVKAGVELGGYDLQALAVDPGPDERRVVASWFVDELWNGLEGYACLDVGDGGHLSERGRYEFDAFRGHSFRWPSQRDQLLDFAMSRADASDVYICPMLRCRPRRRQGEGLLGRHLWADVDEWTPELATKVDSLLRLGSFVLHSGRGRHVYLALEQPAPAATVQDLNHRLAATINADHKWPDNSLLRLPGTFNHKGRAAGGPSALVFVEWSR